MNEQTLQLIAILKLLFITGYAALYGYGGMRGKWKRRIVGSIYLTIGIVGFSLWTREFSLWYLLCFLLLFGATSLGYRGDKLFEKLWKRFYCGLAYACWCLPIAVVTGAWTMFTLHTILCVGMSMTLGTVNPVNARYEETLMGVSISLLPFFMV